MVENEKIIMLQYEHNTSFFEIVCELVALELESGTSCVTVKDEHTNTIILSVDYNTHTSTGLLSNTYSQYGEFWHEYYLKHPWIFDTLNGKNNTTRIIDKWIKHK